MGVFAFIISATRYSDDRNVSTELPIAPIFSPKSYITCMETADIHNPISRDDKTSVLPNVHGACLPTFAASTSTWKQVHYGLFYREKFRNTRENTV